MLQENDQILAKYRLHMQTAYMSPETIRTRLMVLRQVAALLDERSLLAATPEDLERWQESIRHLTVRTVRCYTSHVLALYRWAQLFDLRTDNPTRRLTMPAVHRGVPRPIPDRDLETIFAVVTGIRRLIYALAAFAGLRCAEITRLQKRDVDLYSDWPALRVHGKGRRERMVPLIEALAAELHRPWRESHGWIVTNPDGRPFAPNRMAHYANDYLHAELGISSTLHSLRHWYGTNVARMTKDPLFVRDLLGHSSVTTTEVYMDTVALGGHDRLAGLDRQAARMLGHRHLRAVKDEEET